MEYYTRKHHPVGGIVKLFKSVDKPHKHGNLGMKQ